MKKIALDLDGVVFDSENLYRVYTEIYDVEHFKKDSLIDNTQRVYQKRYSWTDDESKEFYDAYAHEVLKNASIMVGADIVLKKLSKKYELLVITSRGAEEVKYAKDFFNDIELSNIKIYNGQISKIDKLIQEDVDYIIDDDENICVNASKNNIHAIYFKNNASDRIRENKYLKVVNNWGEIYKYLMLYEGDKY